MYLEYVDFVPDFYRPCSQFYCHSVVVYFLFCTLRWIGLYILSLVSGFDSLLSTISASTNKDIDDTGAYIIWVIRLVGSSDPSHRKLNHTTHIWFFLRTQLFFNCNTRVGRITCVSNLSRRQSMRMITDSFTIAHHDSRHRGTARRDKPNHRGRQPRIARLSIPCRRLCDGVGSCTLSFDCVKKGRSWLRA